MTTDSLLDFGNIGQDPAEHRNEKVMKLLTVGSGIRVELPNCSMIQSIIFVSAGIWNARQNKGKELTTNCESRKQTQTSVRVVRGDWKFESELTKDTNIVSSRVVHKCLEQKLSSFQMHFQNYDVIWVFSIQFARFASSKSGPSRPTRESETKWPSWSRKQSKSRSFPFQFQTNALPSHRK
jgi:hypothetical protein